MRNKIQKYLSGEREGFSLIELIIVIAIMAILIGVIALAVIPYINSSRESKDKQALSSVYSAVRTALADEKIAKETTLPDDYADISTLTSLNAKVDTLVDGGIEGCIKALSSDACKSDDTNTTTIVIKKNDKDTPVIAFKRGSDICYDSDGKAFALPEGAEADKASE